MWTFAPGSVGTGRITSTRTPPGSGGRIADRRAQPVKENIRSPSASQHKAGLKGRRDSRSEIQTMGVLVIIMTSSVVVRVDSTDSSGVRFRRRERPSCLGIRARPLRSTFSKGPESSFRSARGGDRLDNRDEAQPNPRSSEVMRFQSPCTGRGEARASREVGNGSAGGVPGRDWPGQPTIDPLVGALRALGRGGSLR